MLYFWQDIPAYILVPMGAILLAWFGSLQHECMHGHPSKNQKLNDLLVSLPISLWLPYQIYKSSHMAHHNMEKITCPMEDPESYYVTKEQWKHMPTWRRKILLFRNTLFGRMLSGPAEVLITFYRSEFYELKKGNRHSIHAWRDHLIGLAVVFALLFAFNINPLVYAALLVYPSISLSLVRSFAEHRAEDSPEHRSAIVEAGLFWRLLFLNNNYHAVHHDHPRMAWYEIPKKYQASKEAVLKRNGYYYLENYTTIFKTYFFRNWDAPIRKFDT